MSPVPLLPKIRALADAADDLPALDALLTEFLASTADAFGRDSGIRLDPEAMRQDTLAHLGDFLPPVGRILLAEAPGGRALGCVFLRRVADDAGEIKRLYVRPEARGQGLARALVRRLHAEARAMRLARLLLDTGAGNSAAIALYRSLGYVEIPRYAENANDPGLAPHLVFMECARL
jgi:ribosomal protein S18 acetylase RimI-like enzyme